MSSDRVLRGEVDSLRVEVLELRALVARLEVRIVQLESGRGENRAEPPRVASSNSPASSLNTPAASRAEICAEVGRFLRRCLSGLPRGTSGRDRLDLASRYWVVVRDIQGVTYSPPRVFTRFQDCKALVKRDGECGDSVFVGLPAKEDVAVALEAGDFVLLEGFRR